MDTKNYHKIVFLHFKGEKTHFVSIHHCDFIVDFQLGF